jgi:uncharacterized protein (DUF1499 family)
MRILPALATLGFWLVIASLVGVVLSPLGYRLGFWDFGFALRKLLVYATVACILGAVLGLVAWLLAKFTQTTLPGARIAATLIIGVLVSGYVLLQIKTLRSLPMIHDITTDTDNAPQFIALAAARKAAPNGIDYRGAEIAQQQKSAYADIAPFKSELAPQALFEKAHAAALASGWEVAAANVQEGRIEATATTLLYGFKDDVVIRIAPSGAGSVLDMRSMSRVGRSDVGANAKRIREFLARLR